MAVEIPIESSQISQQSSNVGVSDQPGRWDKIICPKTRFVGRPNASSEMDAVSYSRAQPGGVCTLKLITNYSTVHTRLRRHKMRQAGAKSFLPTRFRSLTEPACRQLAHQPHRESPGFDELSWPGPGKSTNRGTLKIWYGGYGILLLLRWFW